MTYRLQSALCSLLVFPLLLCAADRVMAASGPLDEAKLAGRGADSMRPADEDYFELMDNGIDLTADEVKGRNMWLVWTGGNDRFWDDMSVATFGTFDLLKTISSHPSLKNSRDNRWRLSRRCQRALLRQGNRPRSGAFRAVARPTSGGLPAGSVCQR